MNREQVIQWCKDNNCDFITAIFPPPEDWMWVDNGVDEHLFLQQIHTVTDGIPLVFKEDCK